MRKASYIFIATLMLVAGGASIWHVCAKSGEPVRWVRQMSSRYHPVAIEGFSCRTKGVGVAFDQLDIRKRKSGGIILGGFNVLEIKNLALTFYDGAENAADEKPVDDQALRLPASAIDPIDELRKMISTKQKVSGLNVEGLSISRAQGGEAPRKWLEAKALCNRGRRLMLSGVAVISNGVASAIGDAQLVVRDGYFIEYGEGGANRLRVL